MDRKERVEQLLIANGQEHLLAHIRELDGAEQERFFSELERVDWSIFSEEAHVRPPEGEIAPIEGLKKEEIASRREEFSKAGMQAVREGKVAALMLAGGQGTRLGFDGPKGTLDIGVTRPLYIYECLIRNLLEVCSACGAYVPLYIMTSEKTDRMTRAFLKEHGCFGYPEEKVREGRGALALSPNGNGGCFSSLRRAGLMDEAKQSGVEWINVFAVDNVLQRIADPVFVGATLLSGVNCGAKFVKKCAPEERVGVLCRRGSLPDVVEYYDLPAAMANARDERGELVYSFGVTLNYLFRLKAIEQASRTAIPVHRAKKKIPYWNGSELIRPETENGYKYETLVVDWVRLMKSCLPFEAVREREFAPIKNAEGVDSVQSARELLKYNGVTL